MGPRPSASVRLCYILILLSGTSARGDEGQRAPSWSPLAHRIAAEPARIVEWSNEIDASDPWLVAATLVAADRREVALAVAATQPEKSRAALQAAIRGTTAEREAALSDIGAASASAGDTGHAAEGLIRLAALGEPAAGSIARAAWWIARAELLSRGEGAERARETGEHAALLCAALGWARGESRAWQAALKASSTDAPPRLWLERLLALHAEAPDLGSSARWAAQLGHSTLRTEPRAAERWFAEAAALFDAIPLRDLSKEEVDEAALAHAESAFLALARRDVASTAYHVQRAVELGRSAPAKVRATVLSAQAHLHHALGRIKEAIGAQAQAVESASQAQIETVGRFKGSLARFLQQAGRADEAAEMYAEVRLALEHSDDALGILICDLNQVAALMPEEGDVASSGWTSAAEQLLATRQALNRLPSSAEQEYVDACARIMLAQVWMGRQRPDEALALLLDTQQLAAVQVRPSLLLSAGNALSRAQRKLGLVDDARKTSGGCLDTVERILDRVTDTEALALLVSGPLAEAMEEAIKCALAPPIDAAYVAATLERCRGRAIARAMSKSSIFDAAPQASANPSLEVLALLVREAANRLLEARASGQRTDIFASQRELEYTRLRLRESPSARTESKATAPTNVVGATAKAMRSGEALLTYVQTGSEAFAVWDLNGHLEVFSLGGRDGQQPDIAALAASFRAHVSLADAAALPAEFERMARELLVPKALDERLVAATTATGATLRHVYLALGGSFSELPVEAILRGSGRPAHEGPPFTISRIVSQHVLQRQRIWTQAAPPDGPLLALGDPDYSATTTSGAARALIGEQGAARLTNSLREISDIAGHHELDVALHGREATERNLRGYLLEFPYPIVHLACHGLVNDSSPWFSALLLHATGGDDGLLTVDEIQQWRVGSAGRLVVLSACNSGRGTVIPGEGEHSLVRAFQIAGARHVVASLWKVPDDQAADFMIAYHKHRRDRSRNMNPVSALLATQEDFRAAGKSWVGWAGWAIWGPSD